MTNKSYCFFLALTASIILFGCANNPKKTQAVHYECNHGSSFSVIFSELTEYNHRRGRNHEPPRTRKKTSSAIITLANGEVVELPAQKVASGFMVSNGRYTLRGKGNEALWAVGRMTEEKCVITSK